MTRRSKPGSGGPRPIPLILTHGWPWTFGHWSKVIDPLAHPAAFGGDPADAFDVIVPSLPGFGFPGPLTGFSDVNAVHTLDGATLAHRLSDSPAGLLAWLLERWSAGTPGATTPGTSSRSSPRTTCSPTPRSTG